MAEPTYESIAQIVAAVNAAATPNALIPYLQAIQEKFGYLAPAALRFLATATKIPLAQISSVATFYADFRLRPAGKHQIKICIGAACHTRGASRLYDEFRRYLKIPVGDETTPDGQFTVGKVACLGCCMLAPAVQIDQEIYGNVELTAIAQVIKNFLAETANVTPLPSTPLREVEARLCLCSSCAAAGSEKIFYASKKIAARRHLPVHIRAVACSGRAYQTPLLQIVGNNQLTYNYGGVKLEQLENILATHCTPTKTVAAWRLRAAQWLENLYADNVLDVTADQGVYENKQYRIATEKCMLLTPDELAEYRAHDGLVALTRAQKMSGAEIIEQLKIANLRGRGGGGFPTAEKWRQVQEQSAAEKIIICNADEGDPGAFMDRMLLESFPFRVLEGILIAAHAVGATRGIIYLRAEYVKAVGILRRALAALTAENILPLKISGATAKIFTLEIFTGAGAFVCGEETALIASLNGQRGTPRLRPPYPPTRGFQDLPTLINNVETLANVAWIIRHGGEKFSRIGNGGGTKTFALAGKVQRSGLIEVPLGMSIREIVEDIGGGALPQRQLKAVQIGGPSGGCLPRALFALPIAYETLQSAGAMMGSGGLVVLDNTDCMVELAHYFLTFTAAESCGKCTVCRVGLVRLKEILEKIMRGEGEENDLVKLREWAYMVQAGALCGLGKTAPQPVLSTLQHFAAEYQAHLRGTCPAGKCSPLTTLTVTEKCIGCTKCAQHCPAGAIAFTPYKRATLTATLCQKCNVCRDVCPTNAIVNDPKN